MAMKRTTLAVGLLVLAVVAAVHAVSEHDILGFVGEEVACSFLVPDAANGDTLYFGIAGAGGNIGSYNLATGSEVLSSLSNGRNMIVGCSAGPSGVGYFSTNETDPYLVQVDLATLATTDEEQTGMNNADYSPHVAYDDNEDEVYTLTSNDPARMESFDADNGDTISEVGEAIVNPAGPWSTFLYHPEVERLFSSTYSATQTVITRYRRGGTQGGPLDLDAGDELVSCVASVLSSEDGLYGTETTPPKVVVVTYNGFDKVDTIDIEAIVPGLGPFTAATYDDAAETAYFLTTFEDAALIARFKYDDAAPSLTFNGSIALEATPTALRVAPNDGAVIGLLPGGIVRINFNESFADPADAIDALGSGSDDGGGSKAGIIILIFLIIILVLVVVGAAIYFLVIKPKEGDKLSRSASNAHLVEAGGGAGGGGPVPNPTYDSTEPWEQESAGRGSVSSNASRKPPRNTVMNVVAPGGGSFADEPITPISPGSTPPTQPGTPLRQVSHDTVARTDSGGGGRRTPVARSESGTPRGTWTPRTQSSFDFSTATATMKIDAAKLREMADESYAAYEAVPMPSVQDDGFQVPVIVEVCVGWMMAKGLTEEGVFRIPASKPKIEGLLHEFRNGRDNLDDVYDAHEVAGLIKLWTKSENQLFPAALIPKLTAAQEIPSQDERKLECVMEVLAEVPRGRLEVLHLLLDLFVAISNNYKVNKMKPSNMAMVIAPSYFNGMRIGTANGAMEFLIKNRDEIFGGPFYDNA